VVVRRGKVQRSLPHLLGDVSFFFLDYYYDSNNKVNSNNQMQTEILRIREDAMIKSAEILGYKILSLTSDSYRYPESAIYCITQSA
jgi:hypothetical protein